MRARNYRTLVKMSLALIATGMYPIELVLIASAFNPETHKKRRAIDFFNAQ